MALNGSKGGRPKAEESPAKPGKAELSSDNGRKPTGYQTQAQLNREKPGLTQQSPVKPGKPIHTVIHDNHSNQPLSSSHAAKTDESKIITLPRGNALPKTEGMEDVTTTTTEQGADEDLADVIREGLHLPALTNTNMAKDPVFGAVCQLLEMGITAAQVKEFIAWWNKEHKTSRFILSVPFLRRDIGGWYAKTYGGRNNGKVQSIANHRGEKGVSRWVADCPTISGRT
jgi:hypothetical protein